ncbi:methylamine dehydrogenase light chain [Luteithermobacter gelatinilyticus]|uniref:methylamine dehydrogenase light chain n=1 Tax=Luteithermobacter gelatinilyticus TaxID=2582913 RepID=UPI001105A2AC|nr:methylamine dehydrogenase light chain [Luteithermobacter gelatinilyticus]
MRLLDKLTEKLSRRVAQTSSRRGFLAGLGTALVGAGAFPVLPVARASASGGPGGNGYPGVAPQSTGHPEDPGDPASCDYWRYCAIDGFLCSCCGGSQNACPPGTEMSPITWIGTCQNPADGKNYIISYNDCCGKTSCSRCLCNRNEGDRPMVRAQDNNDTNWCLGTSSTVYTCSTAVIIGLALEQ